MVSVPVSAVVVNFPDSGLEAAVRDAIGKPTGDIHNTNLIGLTYLSASFWDIVNLEGIQHCVDLTELKLYHNQIVDISPLSGLTNLTKLYLGFNEIVDINALSGLTNLTRLVLYWNEIVDISALSNLTNLTLLSLSSNQIVDIRVLSGLTNLTELYMHRNKIVDISALSNLTNLTLLYLSSNQIVDIVPLVNNAGIDSGDDVDLSYNQLLLQSGSPDMLDIEALQRRGVNVLFASFVNFPDLALEAVIRSAIGKPTGDIRDTDLIGLTSFDAASRGIADLEGMQYCTDLTWLYLYDNQISDIAPLAKLTNLAWLSLDDNQISDTAPLAKLTNLWYLNLSHNQIVDISALSGLTNLTRLDLQNNQIRDIASLVNNAGIGSGAYVGLRHNLLTLAPGSPNMLDIEALQGRGVRVDFDSQN